MTEPRPAPPRAMAAAASRPAGAAGLSLGWRRVADEVVRLMPVEEIEQTWLFPPVRGEDREWGTAVIARRVRSDRLRVYTGSYHLVVRGRERGQGRVEVTEVGETPDDVLADVLRGVQERAGEAEPPLAITPASWLAGRDEPPAPR